MTDSIEDIKQTAIQRLEEIKENMENPQEEYIDPESLDKEMKMYSKILKEEVSTIQPQDNRFNVPCSIFGEIVPPSNNSVISSTIVKQDTRIHGKYDEDEILEELKNHIKGTYGEHYVNDKGQQTIDFAIADGDLFSWSRTNVKKYISRYGKKEGYNRKDLLKAAHNIFFMLHHDRLMREKDKNEI